MYYYNNLSEKMLEFSEYELQTWLVFGMSPFCFNASMDLETVVCIKHQELIWSMFKNSVFKMG